MVTIIRIMGLFLFTAWFASGLVTAQVRAVVFSQDPFLASSPQSGSGLRVGVLPLVDMKYSEAVDCDSCKWLSPDGVRFFLENYLVDFGKAAFKLDSVQLTASHLQLPQGLGLHVQTLSKNLEFPLKKWFTQKVPIIYRPRDIASTRALKDSLGRVGAALGFSHLLIPTQMVVNSKAKAPHKPRGRLQYSLYIILWDVTNSRPVWAIHYDNESKKADLDKDLQISLKKALSSWQVSFARDLKEYLLKEPQ